MMYNTIGFLKFFRKKNLKNFHRMSQKKNFWEISKIFELDMLYTVFRCGFMQTFFWEAKYMKLQRRRRK